MKKTLALIDQILDEHKQIHQEFQTLDQVSGDIEAISKLETDKTKGYFVPRSLDDEGKGIKKWQETVDSIDRGLAAHFKREETALIRAFERHGSEELASALQTLLREHADLRKRVAKLKQDAADLAGAEIRIEVWEGKGWGIRTNIEQVRDLIEAHARSEQKLLSKLKSKLAEE